MERFDKDALKQAARGQWVDILVSVGGIDAALLNGKPHPCPKCAGTDRFRLVDEPAGAVLCNQCFNERNGDGIAAVQWMLGCDFPAAMAKIAAHLGLTSSVNDNGRPREPVNALALVAREKRVTVESLLRYGATSQGTTVTIPGYDEQGQQCTALRIRCFGSKRSRKGLFEKGKPAGLFLPHDLESLVVRLPQPGEMWCLAEGPKDAAALSSLGLLAAGLPRNEMAKKFGRLFRGCKITVVPDLDSAGVNGAEVTAARLHGGAAEVRIARLPGEIKESGGDDVRDVLHGGSDGEQLV
jgi:hypothetical protein